MEELFLKLLNMSINAGWLVLAVILLRTVFKNAPKFMRCILWGLVGIRLICPISFESVLSLIPSSETVPADILYSSEPAIHSGIASLNSVVNPIIADSLSPSTTYSANPAQVVVFAASVIWVIGIAAMLIYTVISYLRIHSRIREAVPLKDNIYICDRIDTTFILGVLRPKIFLPSALADTDRDYVTAHENAHLSRRDYIWKPLGFLLLTVYWFNPILWVAYILLCRDIELACDERVIKNMGEEIKKPYSDALINCSVPRKMIAACPLAFGETGVKGRIKSVLSYKKPTFWMIVVAVVLCIATAVCFLTNPKDKLESENYGIVGTVSAAECTDVEFRFLKGSVSSDTPYVEVEWVNNTKDALCFGEEFRLFYEDEEIYLAEGYGWNLPLYIVNSGGKSTQICSLSGFDISRSGSYRLEKEFYLDSDSDTKYKAYVEFSIDRRFSFVGLQYKGEKIVFEDGMYSSIIYKDESIPQYCITDEMHLYTSEHPENQASSTWYDAGELESFKLEKETFDQIIGTLSWDSGYSAELLRRDNKNAFRVLNYDDNRLYYLLEQENGEIYLAYGYADSYSIRWIFKMELVGSYSNPVTDAVAIYVYNDSPEPITAPSLNLNYTEKTFHFTWSLFSSYLAMGNFEIEGSSVICTTNDGENVYVFHETDYGYVFDGKRSSQIPSYKYSADAKSAECPVPDGAKFVLQQEGNFAITGSGENVNPSFNATVLSVYENSVLVEPMKGEDERASSDKIVVSTSVKSTNPVPDLKKGDQIRIVYNGTIEETYPAGIGTVFAIYRLDEIESGTAQSGESLTDKSVKSLYLLERAASNEDFEILKTLDGIEASQMGEFLNTAHLELKTEGNWVKFNPATPNNYAVAIALEDNSTLMLNIHFSSDSTVYYVAVGETEQEFNIKNDYSRLEYNRYVASNEFGKFLSDLFS